MKESKTPALIEHLTNIVTGPDGNLYVTSLTNGAVYMISR